MNPVELYKYAVATIGSIVAVILIVMVSGAIYGGAGPGEPQRQAAAPAAAGGGDLVALLGAGDAAAGAVTAIRCRACHTVDEGGANRVGPNLWGVVGAPRGAVEGYAYSEALAGAGGTWTYAELDGFLTNPREYLPSTKMTFVGIPDAADRANVILHLRALSNDPQPLPAA